MIETILFEAKSLENEQNATDRATAELDVRGKLSALWIFVLVNMLFRDMHEFARVGFLEGILEANAAGTQASPELVLIAGIVLELAIVMIILSRFLNMRINRWANIAVALIFISTTIGFNLAPDLDDLFFAGMEIIGLITIIVMAWRWKSDPA